MPLDYLKLEYKERINKGPIEYKLQVQLHEAKPMTRIWYFISGGDGMRVHIHGWM